MEPSITVTEKASEDWDLFVSQHPEASIYHRSGWCDLVVDVFGHRPAFIHAHSSEGELVGILPLVRQKSVLFGTFATSVPFFNYGGALAKTESTNQLMMEAARLLAKEWRCSYLELRDIHRHQGDWSIRTDKVAMILDLPESFEELSEKLGAKIRSQAKRADREHAEVVSGKAEILSDFYDVFCHNMRDLGTPVYPRRFFEAILKGYPTESRIICIRQGGIPMAAAFLLINGDSAEIPWAACRREAKPMGFNMKLYWEVLSEVMERGCRRLDFGRSTTGSGTFRFKTQWGARPIQLHWHRWERESKGGASLGADRGKMMHRASTIWQHLPLPIANLLGPCISPSLPW